MEQKTVKPFLKWAGGKSQLLAEIGKKYPTTIDKYCEPFLGGGAVLFDILSKYQPKEIFVNDINKELINTYRQVQSNCKTLIKCLQDLQALYLGMNQEERKNFYFSQREKFNTIELNGNELVKAALFIFLNRTCFNGLYRVNSKGLFNVPMGSYKNPLICDTDNLSKCSEILKPVTFLCGDYSKLNDFIDSNTFVYFDPPYRPLSVSSSFNAYSEFSFKDSEQIALGKFIDSISSKGAKFVLSNSDPKNTNKNDNFFDDLYSKYSIYRIEAKRMINSNASNRDSIYELLVSNF